MGNLYQSNNLKRFSGAVRSKHPAAYLGLAIKTIAPLTQFFDLTIQKFVRPNRSPELGNLCRCVFIVCPPRSGGTVIYQALTHALPSIFLSNLHALLPNFGTRILRIGRERLKSPLSFNNYYGYTSHLLDVYEGNEFFEWVHQPLGEMSIDENNRYLRHKFIQLVNLLAPLPSECVIFKNARFFSVVQKIHQAVPEIIFIRVKRDPNQVIESVVRAFYDLGHFHPVPESVAKMSITDPIEFACYQIEAIEASLNKQFACLPDSSQFTIPYEAFCERPYEFINTLAYDFLKLSPGSVRDCPDLAMLTPSRRQKVSDSERLRIHTLAQERFKNKGI